MKRLTKQTANQRQQPGVGLSIPPKPTILFPELGQATVFAGRDKIDELETEELKFRTFWQENIDDNM